MPTFDPTAIFRALRMQNVLGPTMGQIGPNLETGQGTYTGEPITPQFPNPPNNMQAQPMMMRGAMQQQQQPQFQYEPETRATDKLYELLDKVPERNKPGILRKIGASVIGMGGGPKAADQALYAPYYQQMQDFEAQFKPTLDVAQQERLQNVNLRQIATEASRQDLAQERERRLAEEFGQREERLRTSSEAKMEIDRQKLELAKWKVQNPDGKLVEGEDGFVYLLNPQTGEERKTNIQHGSLSDIEKINLGLESALTRIKAQGAETRKSQADIEATRQVNRLALVKERERARTQRLTQDKRLSVSQDAAAWKLARQQYIADNPTHADFWDDITGLPSRAAESDDTGEYQDAVDEIRDRYNRIKSRATPAPVKGNVAPAGTPPIRTIRIKNDKTNQTATMPENKPVPNGWKKVGYVE